MTTHRPHNTTFSSDTPPSGSTPVDRSAVTQVGQVLQSVTERVSHFGKEPTSQRKKDDPEYQQLADLMHALGDPQHPRHANAVDELVKMGATAIPSLNEALLPQYPWLTSYRAAEALGLIGSGRATSALIRALRHPNSNVRWSVVRALSQVGDMWAIFELRRVAQQDHSRTSWGESVSGAAQSVLDQVQVQGIWSQSLELMKTAITCVLMILSLILAFSVVTTMRDEFEQIRQVRPGDLNAVAAPIGENDDDSGTDESSPLLTAPTAQPTPSRRPTSAAESDASPVIAEPDGEFYRGTVLNAANVRPFPSVRNEPIGFLSQGDEILFLARSNDYQWYLVRLGNSYSDSSSIENPNGTRSGWVHRMLLSSPDGDVPVEEIEPLQPTPTAEDDALENSEDLDAPLLDDDTGL
ncbi:MAG: SH3 domain-containing protein [Chloroflexaceae bacterium]|nr:SH3 domain-containing protein [Chloroflexaceae bacterium]